MRHFFPLRPISATATLAVFALALTYAFPATAEPPKVVATIKPVHGIVSSIMKGVAEPELMIDGSASPHGFSLKPSQAALLQEAGIIFWIGPTLETFLEKPLATIGTDASAVSLIDADGVSQLPFRELDEIGADDHDHDLDHDHAKDQSDPHVWLDPKNAAAMAEAVRSALAAADPENAAIYDENAEAFQNEINKLEASLESVLKPAAGRKYLVFHDAYHYLEDRFGLTPAGAISISPESPPGARHLADLRERIESDSVACLFAEPQFPQDIVGQLTADTGVQAAVLDPLGAGIPAGSGHYSAMMLAIAQSMASCLTDEKGQ